MKIAVIPNDYGIAHITRSFEIAKALSQRDVDVVFCITSAKLGALGENLSKYNITHREISGLVPQENDSRSGIRRGLTFIQNTNRRLKEERIFLKSHNIDAVVADFSFSSLFAAYELGIPSFLISNSYNLLFPIGDLFFHGLTDIMTIPVRILFFLLHLFFASLLNTFPALIVKPWKILGFWWYVFSCTKIVPEPQNKLIARVNPHAIFVGWIPVSQYEDLPIDIEQINKIAKGRPLVYLTTGGTGFGKNDFEEILLYLVKCGYFVLGSTGGRFKVKDDNENYFVRDFLPGGTISNHVSFVVNHGGQGSLMQAITNGKYVFAWPQMLGQFTISNMLLTKERGKILYTKRSLLRAISKFSSEVKSSQIAVGKSGAVQSANIIIESLKRDK